MIRIFKMLKPYRKTLILSMICSALYAVLEISLPMFTKQIMSKGILGEDMGKILLYGGIMLAMSVVCGLMSFLNTYFSTKTSVNYANGIRNTVFEKVSHLSQCDVDKISVSSLMTRTTNDVRQVHDVILSTLKSILPIPIMLVGGFVMAYQTNKELLKLIFVVIPVLLVIVGVLLIFILPMFNKVQKLVDKINFILRGKIGGIRVIRAFNKSEYEDNRFDESNEKLTKLSLKANRILSSLVPVLTVALYSLVCYILYASVMTVMEPGMTKTEIIETIPNMYMFVTYFTLIIGSIISIFGIIISIPRASVSAKRINEILETVPEISESENPIIPDGNTDGCVEFRNVTFRYKTIQEEKKENFLAKLIGKSLAKSKKKKEAGAVNIDDNKTTADVAENVTEAQTETVEKNALSNVSFVSQPGEVTAIIGVTGCGKSTLVNLIPRMYDVTDGQILVSGVDIRDLSFETLHSSIAYVPQQSYLFSGTIRDNIKFGNPDATDDEIWRAIEIAQAKSFVSSMPDGLDSFVSQAGKNYSGGQKQRLAIARAIVKNAKIYIFDDSFSALDLATDARLRAALHENLPDANLLIVAQRVSTVISADRIIVMDNGVAVGMGTHQELMNSCDVYKEIVASQLSEEEQEAAV